MEKLIRETEYTITKEGIITSPKGKRINCWKENNTGYWLFRVRLNGKPKCYRLHRILAEAFIPNPSKLPFVKHGDDNKDNNTLPNLSWGTNSENVKEGYENGCYQYKQRAHSIKATHRVTGEVLNFKSLRSASEATGLNRKNIAAVLKGKKTNTYEYNFEYTL